MAKFMVTGGAGFIGSHIVERLLKEGHEVIVFDDFSTGNYKVAGAKIIKETILNKEALAKNMEGVEAVFHEAAIVSVPYSIQNPQKTHIINIEGTKNVLEAAYEKGVRKFVFASSAAVYGDIKKQVSEKDSIGSITLSPYGETKKKAEEIILAFGSEKQMHVTCLRYFNVYGPRNSSGVVAIFAKALKEKRAALIFGDGSAMRDYVYVDDIVDANICSLNKKADGQIINIGAAQNATVLEIWKKLQKIAKTNIDPIFKEKRDGDIEFSSPKLDAAKKILNFKAKVKLDEGLEKTWNASR